MSGGGGQGQRPDAGNRIDSRQRGNASQLLEKYKNLARDAQTQGDRVTAEYYLQFADHYFRVLNEHRARQEEFRERQEGQRERQRYPEQRFEEGENDGGDDLRDEREEDATAPISISGLPPAIGNGASDETGFDQRQDAGDSDNARVSRPRGRGRPPRRQDTASSETGESRAVEDAAQPEPAEVPDERPTRRRAPRRAAASSPQLELAPPESEEEAPKPRRRTRRAQGGKDTVAEAEA